MRNNFKKAFTLSELVIVVIIIGVLAMLAVSSLLSKDPNKDALMVKKAYNTLEKVVSITINNRVQYPKKSEGFFYNPSGSTYANHQIKFCSLIAEKLNTVGNVNCTPVTSLDGGPSFITSDGIYWYYFGFVPSENGYLFGVYVNKQALLDDMDPIPFLVDQFGKVRTESGVENILITDFKDL